MSSERKVREVVLPLPATGAGGYGKSHGVRDGEMWGPALERERTGDGEMAGVSLEESHGPAVEVPGFEGEEELGGHVRSEVNDALARLEMNTLEVKLHLDSIDQRISRMEPHLEGIKAEPQREPRLPEEESRSSPLGEMPIFDASVPPGMPTSERRRRAQGVPVERRRAPFAEPLVEEREVWSWGPWSTDVRRWMREFPDEMRKAPKRTWVPVAMLLTASVGLGVWGLGHRTGSGSASRSPASGPVLAGAASSGKVANSGQMAWAPATGGTAEPSRGTPVGRTRSGSVSVEQGVPAPAGSLGYATPGGVAAAPPEVSGPPPTGASPSGGLTPKPSAGLSAADDAVNSSVAGAAGVAGATGATGTSVVTGASGVTGTTAVPGATGVAGAAGATGVAGNTGVAGTSGKRSSARGAGRVQVSSGVMAGNLIYSQPPVYPRGLAGLFHTEGSVRLQAVISRSGRVEDVRVLSGHYMLRGAAKDAVRSWRYRPYHVNGVPVEVATIVSVEFHR